jgi:hypothetical protein
MGEGQEAALPFGPKPPSAGCAAHLPVVYTARFADRISNVVNRRPASSSSSRLQRGLSSGCVTVLEEYSSAGAIRAWLAHSRHSAYAVWMLML